MARSSSTDPANQNGRWAGPARRRPAVHALPVGGEPGAAGVGTTSAVPASATGINASAATKSEAVTTNCGCSRLIAAPSSSASVMLTTSAWSATPCARRIGVPLAAITCAAEAAEGRSPARG